MSDSTKPLANGQGQANGQAAPAPAPIIRVRGLHTSFDEETYIHQNLDLDVLQGEVLGIVGGSGTGKSVLMRTIIGLQPMLKGEIEIYGHNLADLEEGHILDNFQRHWGVLFQHGALFSTLTVAENIQVPLREFHPDISPTLLDELAAYKIAMVGLPAEAAWKYPAELSGGMVKRAGLARALALDPGLLFLDEPTAGLDPISAARFDALIRSLAESLNLTLFLVTHDLDSLHSICDRVAVLADKQVITSGTVTDMLSNPHPWIQSYFNGERGRAALAARSAQ